MERCKFLSKYFDLESKQYIPFNCDEPPLPEANYCIFHDEHYYLKDPEEVIKKLHQKLENSLQNGPLLIIGYNIPEVSIRTNFSVPVYFNKSKFHGICTFRDATFDHSASFEDCEFNDMTKFELVHFQYVDFSRVIFNEANFIRVFFHCEADFLMSYFRRHLGFINVKLWDSPKKLQIRFDYSRLDKGASFWDDTQPPNKSIDLRHVMSFEGVDLSNVQFSGSYKYGDFKALRISLVEFFSDRIALHLWIFFIGILFFAFSVYYFFGNLSAIVSTSNGHVMAAIAGSLMGGALQALLILKARVNNTLLDNSRSKQSTDLEFIGIIGGGLISGLLIFAFIDLVLAAFDFNMNLLPNTIIVFVSSIAAYNTKFLVMYFERAIKIVKNIFNSKRVSIYEYEKEAISKEEVIEYGQIRKIIIIALPALVFLFVVSLIYTSRHLDPPRVLFFLQIVLLNFVIGYIFRILFQVRRKDFGYNFAKTCMDMSYNHKYSSQKNELKNIKYLVSGLNMYNKYLQREFNVEIKDLEKIFSKLICDSVADKQMFASSIKNCFKTEDKFEPLRYISVEYLDIDTEQSLIRGQFVHKIKDFAIFLATVIPVIISIVQLF
jgi:hypothetical protein